MPVEDLVQIIREDLLARLLLEDLRGETGLLDLARQSPLVVPDVEVPDQLLGDRRAALHDVALRDVLVERAGDAPIVEGAVLPEAGVLDRHRGLRQGRRDLRERQQLAIRRRRDDSELLPVVGVEERVLRERKLTKIRGGALREQDLLAGEGDGGEHERDEGGQEKGPERAGCCGVSGYGGAAGRAERRAPARTRCPRATAVGAAALSRYDPGSLPRLAHCAANAGPSNRSSRAHAFAPRGRGLPRPRCLATRWRLRTRYRGST